MIINQRVLDSTKCADAFNIISWSVLLLCSDFYIALSRNFKINLIPDFLGWLIIAVALSRIAQLSPRLANMRKLTAWLMGLSLLQIVQSETTLEKQLGILMLWIHPVPGIGIWGTVLFTLVSQILTATLVCQLCNLIADMAITAQAGKLQRKATLYKKIYLAVVIACFLPLPFFPLFAASLSQWIFMTLPDLLFALLTAKPALSLIFILIVMLLSALSMLPSLLMILLIQDAVQMCRRYTAQP